MFDTLFNITDLGQDVMSTARKGSRILERYNVPVLRGNPKKKKVATVHTCTVYRPVVFQDMFHNKFSNTTVRGDDQPTETTVL